MKLNLERIIIITVTFTVAFMISIFLIIGMEGMKSLAESLINLGYLGAFLSGVIGTSTLMISIFPPHLVVALMSVPEFSLSPFLISLSAGLGSGLMQYLHYYIGAGGRSFLSEKNRKAMEKWSSRLSKYGLIIIFLFAITPLTPDDLIWIPLGIMNYPKYKALIAGVSGKISMFMLISYSVHYGIEFIQEQFLGTGG